MLTVKQSEVQYVTKEGDLVDNRIGASLTGKWCGGCKEWKFLEDFHKNKARPDGLATECKECVTVRTALWYRNNTDKCKLKALNWNRDNPQRRRAIRIRSRYSISIEDYNELLLTQDGGCAICGKTPEEENGSLSIDHDHRNGKVRGLLCRECNAAIGKLKDDPALVERALLYLMKS